ncbi:hypothetical protein BLX24_14425 [Arsenicibacter rosenii]|uniref:Uncharacterized protein n=1 Tax=Arsenicibacter rosenii TaxID=1750698 RepID=A0A1S2VKM8_9BACT|nr:hypothetical protein BLX24_14425 [Arsenicibacter rosenii]
MLVALSGITHAQTRVVLQGACTDCSAEITSFINCSVAFVGTIQANAVIGPGVTQAIQVSVGKKGKYSFATTGTQTVTLTASGVATTSGTTTFTLTQNGQSCSFNRVVGAAVVRIAVPSRLPLFPEVAGPGRINHWFYYCNKHLMLGQLLS